MDSYPKRVRDNILPLSVASTLPEAFEEWSLTDDTIDHEESEEICGLCDKDGLRFHFRIENVFTSKSLWVGSPCILQFGVSVFENGQKLSAKDTKRKLDRLTDQMRLNFCLKALTKLAEKEGGALLKNALEYFRKNKSLSPRLASVVLWQLDERAIDHSPSFFKVTLKRDKHKEDLKALKPRIFKYVWRANTSSEKISHLTRPR